ncbi:hypothetical protein C8P68_101625 [Mucilaginibacter yixingensis]|uniref:Lipoprotein n=1 Tax=Mucilaginibacter yixingensis TaxID=1295612 RepID=A0A2T5JG46_9SPHI|nr:hypothetical protein [Mucilaginibacter yixingensis]PTR01391.1 hypothetical protein C8P68_101625 [Mucilaginibacter yixingensis]
MPKPISIRTLKTSILTSLLFLCILWTGCKRRPATPISFYYWKTSYALNKDQQQLLAQTAGQRLYLRLFDIRWDAVQRRIRPNAVIRIHSSLKSVKVTPVIFITNATFLHTELKDVDSLAFKTNRLVSQLSDSAHISYQKVQFDCDWTDDTREKYFAYLQAFRHYSGRQLEATIRLHQVKYRERTGIPPVNRGVLMFYNMGQLSALSNSNSIYNEQDAARYLNRLNTFPLPLDVALPLFSWAIHSRAGHIMQIYPQITRQDLSDLQRFKPDGEHFRAIISFFMKGVYVRENDIFKLEETDAQLLKKAATQLSPKLRNLPGRTIIFYELANINLSQFDASTLGAVADRF